MIKKAIEKLPAEAKKNIETYSNLIERAVKNGNKIQNDEFRYKLRGYLECLKTLRIITEVEFKSLYLWYACDRYK